MIYGYDYEEFPLEPLITAFETLAGERVALGTRESSLVKGLMHPVHQQGAVVGWELN